MNYEEQPIAFSCREDTLIGILSMPERPLPRAVLIIVGGPQYRAGSHRQFVLLSRVFAAQGYPVMRFDYRGMGDSEGEPRNFERIAEDIRGAIDSLIASAPCVKEVVLWGLCDGASAATLYAAEEARVAGLVLVNPWWRSEEGEAKALLAHYYQSRLRDAQFWKKIARGGVDFGSAARSFWTTLRNAYRAPEEAAANAPTLPERMYHALSRFKGGTLLILSENDLTAQECAHIISASPGWQALIEQGRIERQILAGANHTFSRRRWRDQVATWTLDWLGRPQHPAADRR